MLKGRVARRFRNPIRYFYLIAADNIGIGAGTNCPYGYSDFFIKPGGEPVIPDKDILLESIIAKPSIMKHVVLFFTVLLVSFCCSEAQSGPELKGKKVLIVFGGWDGHEPGKYVEILTPWLMSEGASVDTCSSPEIYANKEFMATVDLVIQVVTMAEITADQESGLLEAVRNSAGIAGWHGGLADSFRNNPAYQYMVGGQWVAHPGGVIDYTVHITSVEDPVTRDYLILICTANSITCILIQMSECWLQQLSQVIIISGPTAVQCR
ncbi:MAG: ThuA domain-containing protein [Marinilabiliales bacterium]|nr:ThuA domain-containing protein [Marinilabiliales bacterium]